MNELLQIFKPGGGEELFGPLDVLLVMASSVLLLALVTKSYQATHRGTSYAPTFLHSLFLMGLCTGIVMMIIGSNIARAFSLVGALSIIRFRTAVKDVRDTAYLFFAIVIGMGCGTGFFLHTALFTVAGCGVMWLLHRFDYGSHHDDEEVLKVSYRRDSSASAAIAEALGRTFGEHRLINSVRNFDGDEDVDVYLVRRPRRGADLAGLSEIAGVTRTARYLNDQQIGL